MTTKPNTQVNSMAKDLYNLNNILKKNTEQNKNKTQSSSLN